MKNKILIFGGTTEGREIAEILAGAGIPHAVSVATEYGEEIEEERGEENLFVGRKNADEMAAIIRDGSFDIIVDATHPFATGASLEIRKASEKAGVLYLRLSRNTDTGSVYDENVLLVSDMNEAAKALSDIGGVALILTGSKELKALTEGLPKDAVLYARVLPNEESLKKCKEAGLSGKQIIAMQGPFSTQMNVALIKETHADVILTKESGLNGGFTEKLQAARKCKIKTVVIKNPESSATNKDGKTMSEIISELENITGFCLRRITVAGMGPGDAALFTADFEKAVKKADIIFGAATVNALFKDITGVKTPMEDIYGGEEILDYLKKHPCYKNPLVIYSGDISLCSGALKATEKFEEAGYKVYRLSGISSVSLFANRLNEDLERCKIISAHGKEANITGNALKNERLIVLTSGYEHAKEIAKELPCSMRVILGYELGSKDEKIVELKAGTGTNKDFVDLLAANNDNAAKDNIPNKGRCLLYIENPKAKDMQVGNGIADEEFIRNKVPMTKEEIRALTIRKLGLSSSSVFYDIGAGTGSVSIEASLLHPDIKVYSIEQKKEAIEILRKNRDKFFASNMEIVEGTAPDALKGLPAPTHVFIGGSSGNMKEIITKVKELNRNTKIVINCLTLQTLSEVVDIAASLDGLTPQITQIAATRFKRVGKYDLPDAQNPVYIISF